MKIDEELDEFANKVIEFCHRVAPKWLTPNSHFVGIKPGHNLDLLEIAFDFRIDRTTILLSQTPQVLKDPEKPDLSVVKP